MDERQIRAQQECLICEALHHVLASLPDAVTAAGLAHLLGYSPSYFRRVFSVASGEAPSEFARRSRLEVAAGQLTTTDQSIAEVSAEAGFQTAEAFCKAFHSHFGMAPTDFRASNREKSRLLPGYVAAKTGNLNCLPTEVGLVGRMGGVTSYLYDGVSFRGRWFPDGHIEPPRGRGGS